MDGLFVKNIINLSKLFVKRWGIYWTNDSFWTYQILVYTYDQALDNLSRLKSQEHRYRNKTSKIQQPDSKLSKKCNSKSMGSVANIPFYFVFIPRLPNCVDWRTERTQRNHD